MISIRREISASFCCSSAYKRRSLQVIIVHPPVKDKRDQDREHRCHDDQDRRIGRNISALLTMRVASSRCSSLSIRCEDRPGLQTVTARPFQVLRVIDVVRPFLVHDPRRGSRAADRSPPAVPGYSLAWPGLSVVISQILSMIPCSRVQRPIEVLEESAVSRQQVSPLARTSASRSTNRAWSVLMITESV